MVSTPLKNISQMGWLFPIYGKIENVPNHQPVGLSMFIMLYHDFTRWCQIFSKWSALWTMVYTEPRISWNDQGSSLMAPRNPRQRRKTVALGFKLSTFTTQNAKRTFWNACSERRGVFSGFMDPRSLRILFLLPAKRIHSITWPAQFYLNQAKKGSVFGLTSAF